jgi:hypothetical protein
MFNKVEDKQKIRNKCPTILFFGYPTGSPSVDGLIWLKNVADYIDQNVSSSFSVLRIVMILR